MTFVLRYPRQISLAGVVATVVLTVISLLILRPDERNANALPDNCEPLIALQKMDRALGGLERGTVEVRWDNQIATDSPEVLTVISEIDELLRSESLIGHPLSIRNLLDALPGEGNPADRMSMLELLPPPLKRAFYTPEIRHAQVGFRVQDLGIAKYGPVFQRLARPDCSRLQAAHPGFRLELSGSAVWRWENLYQIVVDLAASLGSAAFIIFLVLTISYRSVRIGLISLVPNLFPLGSDRNLSGRDRAGAGVGQRVCLYDLSGDCRRRHHSFPDAISGRADAYRRPGCGNSSRVHGRGNGVDHDHRDFDLRVLPR